MHVFGFLFHCLGFRFGQRSIGSAAPRSDYAASLVRTVTATVDCEPIEWFLFDELIDNHLRTFSRSVFGFLFWTEIDRLSCTILIMLCFRCLQLQWLLTVNRWSDFLLMRWLVIIDTPFWDLFLSDWGDRSTHPHRDLILQSIGAPLRDLCLGVRFGLWSISSVVLWYWVRLAQPHRYLLLWWWRCELINNYRHTFPRYVFGFPFQTEIGRLTRIEIWLCYQSSHSSEICVWVSVSDCDQSA